MNSPQRLPTELELVPRDEQGPIPLTASQRNAWQLMPPASRTRQLATAYRIRGDLDLRRLRAHVAELVRRHEALRTRILENDGVPMQTVDVGASNSSVLDGPKRVAGDRDVQCIAEDLVQARYDPAVGPSLTTQLLELSAREHVLLMAADHLVSDGTSMSILGRELWTLYRRGLQGPSPALAALRVQFPDYAHWQHRMHASWRRQHEAYWRDYLAHAPPTRLPVDRSPAHPQPGANARDQFRFSAELTNALRRAAERERIPLAQLVMTAYACLIGQWCRQRDLVLQCVTHGRHAHPDLATMVGYLANLIHIRIELDDAQTLAQLIRKVHGEFVRGFEHYDFGRVPALVPECRTDFQFNWISTRFLRSFDQAPGDDTSPRVELFDLGSAFDYKMYFFFLHTMEGIVVNVAYRPEYYRCDTIERLGHRLCAIARALASSPDAKVGSLMEQSALM